MTAATGQILDEQFIARLLGYADTPSGEALPHDAEHVVDSLLGALERGAVRAAERDADGNWHAVSWVKRGILLGFRVGRVVDMSVQGTSGAMLPDRKSVV